MSKDRKAHDLRDLGDLRQRYERDGFVVARGLIDAESIAGCLREIELVFRDQARKCAREPAQPATLDDVILAVMRPGSEERALVYDFVRNVPSLRGIGAAPWMVQALSDLGMALPICLEVPTVRIDIAGETEFQTVRHQDIRSVRSGHAITTWFPFRPCDAVRGSIAVYRGSHALGVCEYRMNGRRNEVWGAQRHRVGAFERVPIEAEPGDAVFMNSLLVHESQPNTSPVIKLNGQVIYNDALAVNFGDEFWSMRDVPEFKDL